jgi:hypothetical protein
MKTDKLKLALLDFSDNCKNKGQSGLISCGIAKEIRETQSEGTIFWLIENLISSLEIADFDKLKTFATFTNEKICSQLDNFVNKETDYIKQSHLSRIDFHTAKNKLNEF